MLPVRFLLYWLIKLLVLLYLGVRSLLRPRAVRYGLVVLLVAGAVAWRATGTPTFLASSQAAVDAGVASTVVADQMPQPAAVEQYFRAQAGYDASGMWEAMNDQLKVRMTAANNSRDQLQKELDTSRQQNRGYGTVVYVGGAPMTGGRTAYFYVLTVDNTSGSTRLPYTFVVDPDGKISNIQWSMDR